MKWLVMEMLVRPRGRQLRVKSLLRRRLVQRLTTGLMTQRMVMQPLAM